MTSPTPEERPVPRPDRIRLSGIAATGYHGVFDHERRDGQTFVADVVLHVDTRPAAAEDRLDRTVHYGLLAEGVAAVLRGEPADLVETVAERIAALALAFDGVGAVDVVLHKPMAPIAVPFGDVTVEVHRSAAHPPVVAPPVDALAAAGLASPAPVPAVPTADPVPTAAGPAEVAAAPTGSRLPPEETTDRLDVVPATPARVVLALGSNQGDSHELLRRVVHDLAAVPGLEVTAVAPLARTGAVGGPEQPDYLNTVVLAETVLSPRALLRATQALEAAHGRVRAERWGPRTVDIDIVVHGTTVASSDDLELPHPRAHERAFVLQPWAQVDPEAVLPGLGGGPVLALAQTAPDRDGIRWMALDWWTVPPARDPARAT